jgi:hypothetical protein
LRTRGTIYHHSKLIFYNGFTGKKYLILLNTPTKNEPYLFVKTTSQKKNRPAKPGCIKERSLFFIPGGKAFFKRDTWVQLFEIYEFLPEDIDTNKGGVIMITDTEIRIKGVQILTKYLGDVEAERFIALIQREPFDYTKWRQGLDEDLSIEEISQKAMALRIKNTEQGGAVD